MPCSNGIGRGTSANWRISSSDRPFFRNGTVLRAPLSELHQEIARQQSSSEGHVGRIREREHIMGSSPSYARCTVGSAKGQLARLGLKADDSAVQVAEARDLTD